MERSLGRVRVAISIPAANPNIINNGQFHIHVGHARTLYLGWLFAQKTGLPFHVRMDGWRTKFGDDLSLFALDLWQCLNFLSIKPERVYWANQWEELSAHELTEIFGSWEPVLSAFRVTKFNLPAVVDDLRNCPSWIVRGQEFADPIRFNGSDDQRAMMSAYIRFEQGLYGVLGREILQWNVPLITMGGMKLSKTEGRAIHWRVLDIVDDVQRFLLSTAICPDDPSSVGSGMLNIDGVGIEPFEWDWDVLHHFRN